MSKQQWTNYKEDILKSTMAPKLSEFATNTYSLPCDSKKTKISINMYWCTSYMLGKTGVDCIREWTCDKKASSFPLFMRDGHTSPWPGGYLHKNHRIQINLLETSQVLVLCNHGLVSDSTRHYNFSYQLWYWRRQIKLFRLAKDDLMWLDTFQ